MAQLLKFMFHQNSDGLVNDVWYKELSIQSAEIVQYNAVKSLIALILTWWLKLLGRSYNNNVFNSADVSSLRSSFNNMHLLNL